MDPVFWALILVALAVALIVLEVFLPSAGLLGVAAAICLVVAVAIAVFAGPGWWRTVVVVSAAVVLVPTAVAGAMHALPRTPLGRTILAIPDVGDAVLPAHVVALRQQVGRFGLARTAMMPAGVVLIDGKRYDAVSEGPAIDPGKVVRVVAIRVGRLVVAAEPDLDIADLAGGGAAVPVAGRPSAAVPAPPIAPAAPTASKADPPPPPAPPAAPVPGSPEALTDDERRLRQSLEDLGLGSLDLESPPEGPRRG